MALNVRLTNESEVANHPYIYKRTLGKFAPHILANQQFEPGIPDMFRKLAASSQETLLNGGYTISSLDSSDVTISNTCLVLSTSPGQKPLLGISFISSGANAKEKTLNTLLVHNEFQYTIGFYAHDSDTLYIYADNEPMAKDFILQEGIIQSIDYLRSLGSTRLVRAVENSTPKRNMILCGYNNSFGHAHWNDVLGHLSLRELLANSNTVGLAELGCIVGPKAWIDYGSIYERIEVEYCGIDEYNKRVLEGAVLGHWPIGFRITNAYQRFWRYKATESTSLKKYVDAEREVKPGLGRPNILISLRKAEAWRDTWRSKYEDVIAIVQGIKDCYPYAHFWLDGLTMYARDILEPKIRSCYPEAFIEKISEICKATDISGMPIGDKLVAYNLCSYGIFQHGSGAVIPQYVFSMPSIHITGNTEILGTYNNPEFITRLVHIETMDVLRCCTYLPAGLIRRSEDGFTLDQESTMTMIRSHMALCGI